MSHILQSTRFKLKQSLTLSFLLIAVIASATHNRAGEITYEQIDDLTIRATITTYTKASSDPADRDTLEICWGDGTCEWLSRSNGVDMDNDGYLDGVELGNDIKRNQYISTHTYPGPSHYVISMQDPNRNAGILNVNYPNSEGVEFFIQTTVTFLSVQFQGYNNSPELLQPPIDFGCVGERFIHNPNAFEKDGDSLSYHLITPLRDVNQNVPNYIFPNLIDQGLENNIFLDPVTGDFIWDSPQQPGEYNIAMRIVEYRSGQAIDTLIRDMQINIAECTNQPPEIETIEEICVVAGEVLEFDVTATDPDTDPLQLVELTALGGPFEVNDSAEFIVAGGFQAHPLVGTFRWQTACEHISDQYYSVVFKAVDNHPGTSLADLKTVRIKVVGPPPLDVQADAGNGEIKVNWESPYFCEDADEEYFRGFSVWRREGSNIFPIDTCDPGLTGKGYTRLTFGLMDLEDDRYFYNDNDVERGRTYCYRIVADFAKLSPAGNPFNLVESLPSDEVCVQLNRDIPLITNVDVDTTDENNGEMIVRWTKPKPEDLDTLQNPGPYTYELLRSTGITSTGFTPVPGATFTSPNFYSANDTVFVDKNLNTVDNAYSYQLAFYTNSENTPLGITSHASSVYLSIAPTDEANDLSWEEDVPWDNFEYTIFRKDPGSTTFDSITTVIESSYKDEGLINGEEYCYYILSKGSYGVEGIMSPLFNRSQQVCSVPEDNVPPCPPELEVSNICDDATNDLNEEDFINSLLWTNPNEECEETDDVAGYNIYYTEIEGGEFRLIESTAGAEGINYDHQPDFGVAGCYYVTAIDFTDNESAASNIVCLDNCPLYELPNVFTPNGDNANELFIPFRHRFIDHIELKVFNRWGQLVFETEDLNINWDGTNLQGKDLAEATYFYKCIVYEQRVSGVVASDEVLSGFIEIVRGRR